LLRVSCLVPDRRAQSCYDVCNDLTKDAAQTCDQYDNGDKLADVLADDETVEESAKQRNTVLDMDRAVYHDKEAGESTSDIIRDVVDNCKKGCDGD
jgi:hypothetical protein